MTMRKEKDSQDLNFFCYNFQGQSIKLQMFVNNTFSTLQTFYLCTVFYLKCILISQGFHQALNTSFLLQNTLCEFTTCMR